MTEADRKQLLLAGQRQLQRIVVGFAQPERLVWLQRGLYFVLAVWSAYSLAGLLWTLLPNPSGGGSESSGVIVNPVEFSGAGLRRVEVDLETMLGLGLFGDPVNELALENAAVETAVADSPRDGIEAGARETQLDLLLTGIVASTEDGLGSAMIEAKGAQDLYAVGDDLPVSGAVSLAKVMQKQVVLDNNGTYELLSLFEDDGLSSRLVSSPEPPLSVQPNARLTAPVATEPAPAPGATGASTAAVTRLAADYRRRLYENPQSLAQVVKVSAVSDNKGVRGYRLSPGSDPKQFRALGFRAGDVVTAVNGLTLDDPTNTVRLYQMMRDVTEATFEIERDGGVQTLAVSLADRPEE